MQGPHAAPEVVVALPGLACVILTHEADPPAAVAPDTHVTTEGTTDQPVAPGAPHPGVTPPPQPPLLPSASSWI